MAVAKAHEPTAQLTVTAVYEPGDDGWIVAWVEEIPGVVTQGRTMEEAREMLADALCMVVECHREQRRQDAGPSAIREPITVRV